MAIFAAHMEQYMDNFGLAMAFTIFAGLSTAIGSDLAFFARITNRSFLSIALGFSAGVMLYVSFIDIFPKAQDELIAANGEEMGSWLTVAAFFGGMFLIGIIDKLVPSAENPHEHMKVEDMEDEEERRDYKKRSALMRTGLFTALAIAIHNFPEGLATFTAMMTDPALGIPIAIAIAIHNIPEGIAVSVPIYFATNSRRKAFMYSFLSGLSEPLGALIGFYFLYSFL